MSTFKSFVASMAISGAVLAGAASTAAAGDYNGDFMIRLGGSIVTSNASADVFNNGALQAGLDADVSTQFIPSATLTYFFNKNVSAELFCCFSFHEVDGKGGLAGADLGDTWIFPPIVTLQYHFDGLGGFKPYVGAGVQWIHFFGEGISKSGPLAGAKLEIDDAFGFVLQAGLDVEIGGGWYLNADVKKSFIDADASWRGTTFTADVELDPWIISANIGYRFNLFGPRYTEPLK